MRWSCICDETVDHEWCMDGMTLPIVKGHWTYNDWNVRSSTWRSFVRSFIHYFLFKERIHLLLVHTNAYYTCNCNTTRVVKLVCRKAIISLLWLRHGESSLDTINDFSDPLYTWLVSYVCPCLVGSNRKALSSGSFCKKGDCPRSLADRCDLKRP